MNDLTDKLHNIFCFKSDYEILNNRMNKKILK